MGVGSPRLPSSSRLVWQFRQSHSVFCKQMEEGVDENHKHTEVLQSISMSPSGNLKKKRNREPEDRHTQGQNENNKLNKKGPFLTSTLSLELCTWPEENNHRGGRPQAIQRELWCTLREVNYSLGTGNGVQLLRSAQNRDGRAFTSLQALRSDIFLYTIAQAKAVLGKECCPGQTLLVGRAEQSSPLTFLSQG